MATAKITIDQITHTTEPKGAPGRARDDLELSKAVTLRNTSNEGVTRWRWTLRDRPIGSVAALSDPTATQVTFTPDIVGTYRISLSINDGLEGQTTTTLAAVRDESSFRFPAAGERAEEANWLDGGSTNEAGWGKDLELILRNKTIPPTESLAATLTAGNTTGGTDIELSAQDQIVGSGGGSIGFFEGLIKATDMEVDGDLDVTGKLTVAGLIDPTGLVLDEQAVSPFTAAGKHTLWAKDTVPTTLWTTDDAGVDHEITTGAHPTTDTLAATLAAGNATDGTDIEISAGDAIVGESGGSISVDGDGNIVITPTARATVAGIVAAVQALLGGAASANAAAGASGVVIGDGSASAGATIFAGTGTGSLYFAANSGQATGGIQYVGSSVIMRFRVGNGDRAYLTTTVFGPQADNALALGQSTFRFSTAHFAGVIFGVGMKSWDSASATLDVTISTGDVSGAGPSSGDVFITTGSSVTGRSGDIELRPGDAPGSTPGQVRISNSGLELEDFASFPGPAQVAGGRLWVLSGDPSTLRFINNEGTSYGIGFVPAHHRVRGSTARGSTNTQIYRWTTVVSSASNSVTYTNSTTLGGYWQINDAGVYAISASQVSGHTGEIAIKAAGSLSNTFNETSILAVTDCTAVTGAVPRTLSWTGPLAAGTLVWLASSAATNPDAGSANWQGFTVTRLG